MIKSNDEYKWAKPVATGLPIIRLNRPFAAKLAANWVMKKWFLHGASSAQCEPALTNDVFTAKTTEGGGCDYPLWR